jgi:hypothetical protein
MAGGDIVNNSLYFVNTMAYSSDGINWLASVSGSSIVTTSCYSIAWNGTLWVAVGDHIAYSSYGNIRWSLASGTIPTTSYTIAWNGSTWIVGGTGTTIVYSTDGANWSPGTSSFNRICQLVCSRRNQMYLVEPYIPAYPSYWESPAPATVQGALDRISKYIYNISSNAIPL